MNIQPFQVRIPQAAIDDLCERLNHIRWPSELPNVGWQYGVPSHYVRRLAEYWRTGYDWRVWKQK